MKERAAANTLLNSHWTGKSLPIDPAAIAEAEGLDVRAFAPNDFASASGWYKVEDGRPVIYFNPTEVDTRARFTIAHELGHHFLGHGPRPRDGSAEFNLLNYDPLEASANRFAAELLMPFSAVRKMVVDRGITSLSALSNAFHVSEAAMSYRLKNLGLLG